MGRYLAVNYSRTKPRTPRTQNQQRGKFENNPPSTTVYIRNLSYDTTEESLYDFLESCGTIKACRIARDADGNARGFAHVEFESLEASEAACDLSDSVLDGRNVYVLYSTPRKNNRD